MAAKRKNTEPFPADERIISKNYHIRGQKVLPDRDLTELYNVETRALRQAVKRNNEKSAADFMFLLRSSEIEMMVSQNVILSKSYLDGTRPVALAEQEVAKVTGIAAATPQYRSISKSSVFLPG